jgi:hypothetical protein
MCSNEVPVGKCLSDSFPIKIGLKQGEVSTLFFFLTLFGNMPSRGFSQTSGLQI